MDWDFLGTLAQIRTANEVSRIRSRLQRGGGNGRGGGGGGSDGEDLIWFILGFAVITGGIVSIAVVLITITDPKYKLIVEPYLFWAARIAGGLIALKLLAPLARWLCKRFDLPRGFGYAGLIILAIIVYSSWGFVALRNAAAQRRLNEDAAIKAEQDRLEAQHQENIRKLFGRNK